MTFVYLWLYITLLLWIWWFYTIARMNAMKFKNFSTHITPASNILMIFLIILSIMWFLFILNLTKVNPIYKFEKNNDNDLKQEIIWDDYY
jgi:amino acid transporter